jgi:hypothetical protein
MDERLICSTVPRGFARRLILRRARSETDEKQFSCGFFRMLAMRVMRNEVARQRIENVPFPWC